MSNISSILQARELAQELALLRQIKQTREDNGIEFYRPHLKQHKFHICPVKHRFLRTGNRFGKSDGGMGETISQAIGGRLWYRHSFDVLATRKLAQPTADCPDGYETYVDHVHPGGHNHPYVTVGIPQRPLKILVLVVDWEMANKIFTGKEGSYENWGKLWKLLPKHLIGNIVTGGRGNRIEKIEVKRPIEFGGGTSTISFDTVESYKHNKVGAESADWDVIHVDEPCPKKMYDAHARGLMDRDGSSYFTCTPLDEMWINDMFCPNGQNIVNDADQGLAFAKKSSSRQAFFIITGSIYDNPYRSQAGVEDYLSGLTREEIACRAFGLPMAFTGLIYREFVYDLHVLCDVPNGWKSFHEPPLDYTIRVAWDVHTRLPQAILKAATAPNGDVFIYDEQFFDSMIEPNASALRKSLVGRNVIDYLIDPYAVIESPVTGESVLDELIKYDLYFEKASKDLTTGISKVRELLKARRGSGAAIYFSPHLTETLFEFSHYVYDSDKSKPKDGQDHMMENLYRLVLNGLDYIAPVDDFFKPKRFTVSSNEYLREPFRQPSLLRL